MKKRKRVKKTYIVYGIILLAYIIAAGFAAVGLGEEAQKIYNITPSYVAYISSAIGFGALIGIIGIFEQGRHIGYWVFEWTKFIVVFAIGFFAVIMHFAHLIIPEKLMPYLGAAMPFFEDSLILVFGLFMLGWAVPASICKERAH